MARSRLLGALLALLALLIVPVLSAPAALAAPTEDPADAAAGWLARQLVEGERFEQDFGDGMVYADAGLTLDAVLAFTAAGSAGSSATAAMSWLAEGTNLADYAGDGTAFSDAGRLAKVAYAELATGGDPADVGGTDVLARLTAQLGADGRFSDTPAGFDASNAFGQSFAVLALARTDGGVPAAAVRFLAGSQCPGGGFPLNYGQPACTSDIDATAMVVQALSVPRGDAPAAAAGVAWLVAQQGADGSFSGTGTTATPNSNSTGLAAQALRAAGETTAADAAGRWLRGLQSGCTAAAGLQGAIAYDGSGFDPGNGVRATAQAVLGLSGVGLAELDLSGAVPDAPALLCAVAPTGSPTESPTSSPTVSPTASPTASSTVRPTASPTASPTVSPSASPTVPAAPTTEPAPTVAPVLPPPTSPAAAVGSLPNTGADVLPILWLGAGLIVVGGAAAVAARRRP